MGTAINIEHRAPTTTGDLLKTEGMLESHNERFYVFRVTAHNGKGRDRSRDSNAGDCESGKGGGAARQAAQQVNFAGNPLVPANLLGFHDEGVTFVHRTLQL